jgi:hypothetical protein
MNLNIDWRALFDDDQPRDDNGQFASTGGGGGSSSDESGGGNPGAEANIAAAKAERERVEKVGAKNADALITKATDNTVGGGAVKSGRAEKVINPKSASGPDVSTAQREAVATGHAIEKNLTEKGFTKTKEIERLSVVIAHQRSQR